MLIPGMVNFTVQGMRSAPIESPANALILSKRAHTVPSGMLWSDEAKSMAQKILQKNIICGNTLTMLDGAGKPMRIPEWEIKDNGSAVRKDVLFRDMVASGGSCENYVSRQKYNWMPKMVVQSA